MTLDELRAAVATMRELGVTEWGDIKLGAPVREATPVRVLSVEEQKADAARREQERLDILFGASGVRPRQ